MPGEYPFPPQPPVSLDLSPFARFDLDRSVSRVMRVERQLAEAMERIQSAPRTDETTPTQQTTPTTALPSTLTAKPAEEVHVPRECVCVCV